MPNRAPIQGDSGMSHGVCKKSRNKCADRRVPVAAANAPTNILPSSAILMTPDRSLIRPPSATKISGVETRALDEKISRIMGRGGGSETPTSNIQAPNLETERLDRNGYLGV